MPAMSHDWLAASKAYFEGNKAAAALEAIILFVSNI